MTLGSTQPLVKNEYQECFLGVKGAGAWGWQPVINELQHSCSSTVSRSLRSAVLPDSPWLHPLAPTSDEDYQIWNCISEHSSLAETFSVALGFDFAQIIVIPLIVAMANVRSETLLIMQNKNVIIIACNIPHLGRRMHHPATTKWADTKHSARPSMPEPISGYKWGHFNYGCTTN